MKYIAPALQIEEAQAVKMIAETLKIGGDDDPKVDGADAKTKEDFAWDIWGDE